MDIEKLKYPIGHFDCPENISKEMLQNWISVLEDFPGLLRNLVISFSEEQLDTPYRPGGWTVRQLVHHIYDSHHHFYNRVKWALTEDSPTIKAYDEKVWASLHDSLAPVSLSLNAIEALHGKLVYLLKGLSAEDLKKEFFHPQRNRKFLIEEIIGMYAWHSKHHFAHIENSIEY